MKTLYLVRHAKSDQGIEGIADIDRPLNTRGYRDAQMMSSLMKEKKVMPDLIITSPAVRAISTALIFCRNLNLSYSNIIIQPNLYATSVKHYIDVIAQSDNQYKSIMLFAHNPTITDLANSLTKPFTENIATCAVVGIRQAVNCKDWKNFNDLVAELILYDFPKNHNGEQ